MGVRPTLTRTAGAALCMLLATPALSPAASGDLTGDLITFTAAAGETNTLTVSRTGTTFTLSDSTAPVSPLGGCAAAGANAVTCTSATVTSIQINLNDMDDTATIGPSITVRNLFINAGIG